jgi:hypothetical protein
VEKQLLKFALGLALAFTVGCGGTEQTPADTGIEKGFGTLSCEDTGCTGSGYRRFDSTLASTTSSKAILFRNVQLKNNGSNFKVVLFSSRPDLTDGLILTLTRAGSTMVGTLDINGATQRTINSSRINTFSPDGFDMLVDVSGKDGSNPKVLIYPNVVGATAVFDSTRAGDLNAPMNATVLPGILSGIVLGDGFVETIKFKDSSQ